MHVFVSHATPDRAAAARLRADLAQLGRQVALDGGEPLGPGWWDGVLHRIQHCEAFVLVLSADSARSPGCLAELRYARALRKPVLLVPVADVPIPPEAQGAPRYTPPVRPGPERVPALRRALVALPAAPRLPARLPPEPPVPYLEPLRDALADPDTGQAELSAIFAQLRARLREDSERARVWGLLVRLRARPDVPPANAAELERLLDPAWRPDPERRVDERYWDGQAWTTLVRHEGREYNERRMAPSQTAWSGQPAPREPGPAPVRSRRRPVLISLLVLLVASAATAGGFLLLRTEAADPTSTVRTFVDAVNVRDVEALSRVACERDRARVATLFLGGGFRLTLESIDTAAVPPTFTVLATDPDSGSSDRRTFPLVRESGEWLVCT